MIGFDSLGDRMKKNYEKRSQIKLIRRMPVIIRLDGRAFHTFTKGFKRPFDEELNRIMRETTIFLLEQIQGAKLAYTQSDEISILVTDYDYLETQAWFDNNIQKICSVSASIATCEFNKQYLQPWLKNYYELAEYSHEVEEMPKLANFDARCFNIPKEEVNNYFVWRQNDWIRNSIQMVAQSLYSHKELHGKGQIEQLGMIAREGIDWRNDYPLKWTHGNTCVKNSTTKVWDFQAYDGHIYKDNPFLVNKLIEI